MTNNNTHPALGLEKVVTRDDALEALKRLSFNCVSYIGKATDKMIVRQALEQSLDGGWLPIEEWSEELGDVAIVFFDYKGELWDTLLSSPISSDYPVYVNGLTGYFKRVDFTDLPQPPKSEE